MKKIYVAFDGDENIKYYNTLKMWKSNENINFDFMDPHELNSARDSSQTKSIKVQLRKRFEESNIFMILIGESTKKLRKFIPWEIEQAINRKLKIIVVNLNGKEHCDLNLTPDLLIDSKQVVAYVPFKLESIKSALNKC